MGGIVDVEGDGVKEREIAITVLHQVIALTERKGVHTDLLTLVVIFVAHSTSYIPSQSLSYVSRRGLRGRLFSTSPTFSLSYSIRYLQALLFICPTIADCLHNMRITSRGYHFSSLRTCKLPRVDTKQNDTTPVV